MPLGVLLKRLTRRVQAVTHSTCLGVLAVEGQLGVFIDALIYRRLQQERRGGAQVETPAQFNDVVQPFFFRCSAHQNLVACDLGQALVHSAVHAVLDGHNIGQLGNACTQLRAHEVAAVWVVPQGDADIGFLAQVPDTLYTVASGSWAKCSTGLCTTM